MSLFVDTSVWSLALRRDAPSELPEVQRLRTALTSGELVYTTGLVLQELLQGFHGPKAGRQIVDRFGPLPLLMPDRDDHIQAGGIRNQCRRRGVQLGTIDALFVRLCLRYDLVLLTTDGDFVNAASVVPLRVWS